MAQDEFEPYLRADAVFYDALHSEQTAGKSFTVAQRLLPGGWRRREHGDWLVFDPGTKGLPPQGWKIHASATLNRANQVIEEIWDYCVPRRILFKFLRSESALLSRVSKYAPRGYSGKLVTIYPVDDAHCEQILNELGDVLEGEPGPYILSDLRWGKGPLYIRYGGFDGRDTVDESGELVPAIADLEGKLVPDRRDPVFYTPPWVALPDFLKPHLAARNAATIADLPYTFDKVLHFSNGGGIYLAKDSRSGKQVVLKEGRPHAGLDGRGDDAVRRVEREYAVLQNLAGIPGIPEVYDLLWVGEHRFMVMEYVQGDVLYKAIASRNPLSNPVATKADYAAYTEWALRIHRNVETTVAAIHDRGIVHRDLHLFNVVVREDDTIVLLDYEAAAPIEDSIHSGLGNPGFAPPRSVTGFGIDRYALACLRLALFLLIMNLLGLYRAKARHFAEIIAEHFPVPQEFLTKAVDTILLPDGSTEPTVQLVIDPDEWQHLRASLVRAITASATPGRDDRLFPGDIQQFNIGGLGLAYGAAGVLYALSTAADYQSEQFDNWLLTQVANLPRNSRIGLFDGLHGVAFVLDHLGYQQEALDIVDTCLQVNWEALGPNLFSGISGIGLNLLHLADRTGEPALRKAAHRAAQLIVDLPDDQDTSGVSGGKHPRAGLFRGRTGQALFLLQVFHDTGDTILLDKAAHALRQDLMRCVQHDDGAFHINEGWRTLPYLDGGSIGLGIVLDEYLAHRHDDQFAEASYGIEQAAKSTMYVFPGLFDGRAGILAYLAGRRPSSDPLVIKQIRNLAWHTLPYADGIAFPGNGLLRLSMDLATGTAGVLLALGAALHDRPVHLPLLTSTSHNPIDTRANQRGVVD